MADSDIIVSLDLVIPFISVHLPLPRSEESKNKFTNYPTFFKSSLNPSPKKLVDLSRKKFFTYEIQIWKLSADCPVELNRSTSSSLPSSRFKSPGNAGNFVVLLFFNFVNGKYDFSLCLLNPMLHNLFSYFEE